jgi:hypothetical protein
MSPKEAEELLSATAAKLGEHFDAVQILASWPNTETDNGGTRFCNKGSGNWFARIGMAHEFIERETAERTADELALRIKPPI